MTDLCVTKDSIIAIYTMQQITAFMYRNDTYQVICDDDTPYVEDFA